MKTTTDDQSEKFIVVDRDDRVIAYKARFECHNDKTLIHRSIGVVVYNSKGEVLLQKRSLTKDTCPGYWAISVGGHVRQGQTYEEAAIREMQEEIGVSANLIPVKKRVFEMPQETEMGMLFKAYHDGPFKIDTQEVQEVRFFSSKSIATLVKEHRLKLSGGGYNSLKEIGIL
jgi:isopentenyl-diphosphate delta-isomerase type 1